MFVPIRIKHPQVSTDLNGRNIFCCSQCERNVSLWLYMLVLKTSHSITSILSFQKRSDKYIYPICKKKSTTLYKTNSPTAGLRVYFWTVHDTNVQEITHHVQGKPNASKISLFEGSSTEKWHSCCSRAVFPLPLTEVEQNIVFYLLIFFKKNSSQQGSQGKPTRPSPILSSQQTCEAAYPQR